LDEGFVDHLSNRLTNALRSRRVMLLHRFRLCSCADLAGVGLDLLQVRRPFDLDRYCGRVAGPGYWCGLRRNRLLRLEFAHRFPLVRGWRRRRFVGRGADVLHRLGNCGCRGMMRAFGFRKRGYGKGIRGTMMLAWRLLLAIGLLATAFTLALVPVAAAATPPSAAALAFALLAVFARLVWLVRLLRVLRGPRGVRLHGRALRLLWLLLRTLSLVLLPLVLIAA